MARTNGVAYANGYEMPPSSMLATHIRPDAGVPHLDQEKFAQLLEESLGQDEHGRPNLGDDSTLNQKLVMVVLQVGIDPLFVSEKGNPFQSSRVSGRVTSQLQQCLAVVQLAVTRTRNLLYQRLGADDVASSDVPLYALLLPKILSVAARSQSLDVTTKVFSIVNAGLQDEQHAGMGSTPVVKDFAHTCLAGFLHVAMKYHECPPTSEVVFEDDSFLSPSSPCPYVFEGISDRLRIANFGELLYISCQLAAFLLPNESSKMKSLLLKKQSAKLRSLVEAMNQNTQQNALVESLKNEVRSLAIAPSPQIESFSTVGEHDDWLDSDRARKRPRLSSNNTARSAILSPLEEVVKDITIRIVGHQSTDLIGFSTMLTRNFQTMSEEDQNQCLKNLGHAACQVAMLSAHQDMSCPVCDDVSLRTEPLANSEAQANEFLEALTGLKSIIQKQPRLRMLALLALRRIVAHVTSSELLRLKGSKAGEWCFQAMRSSSRPLKIASAQALQAFVQARPGRNTALLHDNRVAALEFLQALWKSGQASSQEAVVISLTQMARVVQDEDMNIVLLRLVEYLGHQNAYLAGLVYSEVQLLAQHLQLSVSGLFRPFWRTLSVVIIQHFSKRPTIAQQVADLMGMQVDGLLQLIEEYALPYCVLSKDKNTINRICASSSSPLTPFDLCTKQNNFSRILAFLMMQGLQDPEETILNLLLHVSDDFKEHNLASWVVLHPVEIACEFLKSMGDAGHGKASKPYQGLQLLAQFQYRRFRSSASSSKRSEVMTYFLEQNALAVVTHFTVRLNNTAVEPNIEKRRYITALGEFIKVGKRQINVALPHICACLRAAMDDRALCNTAFGTWFVMMSHIDEDEIRDLINQTFALIAKHWQTLDSSMQDSAYKLVASLFKEHETVIREGYGTLPSLASIPVMSKFEDDIEKLKHQRDDRNQLVAFIPRLCDENMIVVEQALSELCVKLKNKQEFINKSALREQPETFIADLTRAVLDACVKFRTNNNLLLYAGQCLGAIGCLDPSKIENVREKKRFVVLQNFANGDETIGFLMFFMEQILVKEYLSSSNLREKGFLAWSLQRLLQICDLPPDITSRARVGGLTGKDRIWFELSDTTRLVLTPFLTSKFTSLGQRQIVNIKYPFFKVGMTHKTWLTEIALDFLNRGSGDNADIFFDVCCRLVVHGQGTSVASFLLPYAALNLLLTGVEKDKEDLVKEMSWVLQQNLGGLDIDAQDHIRQCSQSVFDMLDYMSLWLQSSRKQSTAAKARMQRGIKDPTLERTLAQTQIVESVVALVPPQVLTQKAVECRSFARALFHQEQHVVSQAEPSDADFKRLQDIYAQIDEPDGIEGFSAQMNLLDVESEIMEHKKAGRWNAAQSWYEIRLTDTPTNTDVQVNLLKCLKESGQHDVLIHHFDGIASKSDKVHSDLLPFAIEASWVTNRWDKMEAYLKDAPRGDFAVGLGSVMLALRQSASGAVKASIDRLFQSLALELTPNSTVSFQAAHESLLKMHVLDEVHIMVNSSAESKDLIVSTLSKRLNILGSNVADKLYVLGIRRALMHLNSRCFNNSDIAASWATSARLARKARATQQAFSAVVRASAYGEKSAAIEQAKLMWLEGDHRKAIQTLEGAIDSGAFGLPAQPADPDAMTVDNAGQEERNDMNAKAFVLLGKWLDQAGQTPSEVIIKTFRKSTEQNRRWEKGWYNLGRHYNKILESEKLKPPGKESQPFLTGEAAKLVIDNFLRALVSGNKYMFETLPKVLTLWLELVGSDIEHDARRGNTQFHQYNKNQRKKVIEETNATVKKYLDRIQPYALYTILPQLVARICHADSTVNTLLQTMIIKVVRAFPQQALWTVLATVKSATKDRATRGLNLLRKAAENTKKDLKVFTASEMRDFITSSQKFSDEVLRIADLHIEGRVARVSLAREFGFNHKIAPSKLVVPSEACLIPNIPTNNEMQINKNFRAFAKDPITISAFLDEARVLPSLQKPRKLSIRGSDGNIYSVLAKPHDDLRKDQRLMEFNTMINRFLKHDIDAAKRRLYIKTYAVIPLNEECGLIEWVDGLTTMRDILLKLYEQRGIKPDYAAVRDLLDKICTRSENKAKDFVEQVQSQYPPVLRQWFIENFPDPTAWFNARIRYTRTSAVMSMVGHVLGLGDRHGENILFEEGTGGILHVDFNCLFDKGLTFEKPECVPFRLTHNMWSGMGTYKYDGPFRRCCEITINLLRNNEDALMTVLETFLHDPTTDFNTQGKKRKAGGGYGAGIEVPDTPERMLEGVKGKVKGMLPGESVPLSVGGYVDYMIRQAKDEANLVRMYIGWCAFL